MVRVLPLVALLLCASLRGSAQGDAGAAQAAVAPDALSSRTAPAQGTLSGHVVCEDTRRPARGALVTVMRVKDGEAADAQIGFGALSLTHVRTDGTYAVEHLPEGRYAVFASLAGYLSDVDQFLLADQNPKTAVALRRRLEEHGIAVVRANASATADLTLQRGASLSGRVLYADGSPAPSITLLLEDAKAPASAQDMNSVQEQMERSISGVMFKHGTAVTDDQGRFRLAGLQAGTYRLAATLPTWENNGTGSGEELGMAIFGVADPRALRVYAGDTLHRAKAKSFALRLGEDVPGVDIVVPVDAFHDLRGTVTAKDGRPVNMGEITLKDTTDDQFSFQAKLSRDGSFVIRQVPAGTYTLVAKDVRIGEVDKTAPAEMPESMRALVPVAAFADASLSVLVKDGEVDGLDLVVAEVSLPKGDTSAARSAPLP